MNDNGHPVDVRNAQALAANLADHREETSRRLSALEAEVTALKVLVGRQTQFIGEWAARAAGSGSTEKDPEG